MTPDRPDPQVQGEKQGIGATALLLVLPILCCGGPFLVAAAAGGGLTAWAGIHSLWLGGGAAIALLAALGMVWRRRGGTRQACGPGCPADISRGGQPGAATGPGHRHALP